MRRPEVDVQFLLGLYMFLQQSLPLNSGLVHMVYLASQLGPWIPISAFQMLDYRMGNQPYLFI